MLKHLFNNISAGQRARLIYRRFLAKQIYLFHIYSILRHSGRMRAIYAVAYGQN